MHDEASVLIRIAAGYASNPFREKAAEILVLVVVMGGLFGILAGMVLGRLRGHAASGVLAVSLQGAAVGLVLSAGIGFLAGAAWIDDAPDKAEWAAERDAACAAALEAISSGRVRRFDSEHGTRMAVACGTIPLLTAADSPRSALRVVSSPYGRHSGLAGVPR